MKRSVVLVAIIYSVLAIAFKLAVFYGDLLEKPLGRLSPFIILLMVIPCVVLVMYLKKKQNGGLIGGKEAVREGLTFVAIIAIVLMVFDYIFFIAEMKDYMIQYLSKTDYKELYKEAIKHKKDITMFEVVKQQIAYERGFTSFSFSRALFPFFALGMFTSFVSAIFIKKA